MKAKEIREFLNANCSSIRTNEWKDNDGHRLCLDTVSGMFYVANWGVKKFKYKDLDCYFNRICYNGITIVRGL